MRIINIVEIADNSLIGVISYPIVDEFNEKEIVERAEEDYLRICREQGANEEEYGDEYLLDECNYDNGTYSVCLTWSEINL